MKEGTSSYRGVYLRSQRLWAQGISAACAFRERTGHLNVPPGHQESGVSLSAWLNSRRNERRAGRLASERIAELDGLGIDWDPKISKAKLSKHVAVARDFYREHGHLDVPNKYRSPDGCALGDWLRNCRLRYQQGTISTELTESLDSIGAEWRQRSPQRDQNYAALRAHEPIRERPVDHEAAATRWRRWLDAAREYRGQHGSLDVPVKYRSADGRGLGLWLKRIRQRYREGMLLPEQIAELEALGMVWEPRRQKRPQQKPKRQKVQQPKSAQRHTGQHERKRKTQWKKMAQAAQNYRDAHGDLKVPRDYVAHGVKLAGWLRAQRARYREGNLTDEQITIFETLGLHFSQHTKTWERNFEAASWYRTSFGNLDVPFLYRTPSGVGLGSWLCHQREHYRAGKLSDEQIAALDELGMAWSSFRKQWDRKLEAARRHHNQQGDINVPVGYRTPDGVNLGNWITYQRHLYRVGKLSAEQISELDDLGLRWIQVRSHMVTTDGVRSHRRP
ncbi:helicase associated domain-containing protein [Sciscionella marina]|uniref:helicase associated domain-containing protein n=1 Tax=Sciscionella marina TaxID=508770 RepID=UPI0003A5E1FA|nr:helicase associated domain-containing protein [Sciscionella marina]